MRTLRLIALGSVIALVAAACGGSATPQPAMAKIIVGFSEIYEGALPMWYAQDQGFFTKNFVQPELLFTASSTGVAALVAGETQIFQGGGSEVLSAVVGGADLVLIGNLVPIYPYVFMAQANIKTIADLKGKKVGVSSNGSTSDIATRVGLAKVGIDPNKDVTILAVGSSQNRTAALLAGSLDAGLDQPPGSIALEAKGLHVLFDLATEKLPVVNNGITVKRTYLATSRAVVQRYVDALVQAIAALRKDKPGGIATLKKYLKEKDESALARTYDYVMGLVPALPYATPEALADSVRVLGAKNDKIKSYDVTKMLDASFVKSAGDRGLDK